MRVNIVDNKKFDKTTLFNNWVENHDWYRSIDTFHNRFPNDWNFTYWQEKNNEVTIFITRGIFDVDKIESNIKIAIPSDLREFHGSIYKFIEDNIEKFDRVITYDERLLKLYPHKCFPSPAMKPWIWPKEQQQIYSKNKLCSFITSTKQMLPGHRFRVEILNTILNSNSSMIDCFGEGHNPLPEEEGKLYGLKDYAFSISMENHQSEFYFSEKLLDVILSGCIPIYWGSNRIKNFFNPKGFIIFNSREELLEIVNNLTFDLYNEKIEYVRENFELCKNNYIDNFHYFVKNGTEWI